MTENPADTQPKSPTGLIEAIDATTLEDTGPHQPYVLPPLPPRPVIQRESGCLQTLLIAGVALAASCMCLAIVSLAGFAGIRDEVEALGTQAVEVQATDVANQYQRGVADMAAGDYELAGERFAYVLTEIPNYQDAVSRLVEIATLLSVTETPALTPTPEASDTPQPSLTPTNTPTREVTEEVTQVIPTASPTRSGPSPEGLYANAETAMFMGNYEEAISWFDALLQLDASYRRNDVNTLMLEALTKQGQAYLRGMNQDGEDQLARGVQLIDRAVEFGYTGELIYEADFVRRYLSARSYVEGGAFGPALDVLIRLCEENCDWAYRGVSVEDLLVQAGGARQN